MRFTPLKRNRNRFLPRFWEKTRAFFQSRKLWRAVAIFAGICLVSVIVTFAYFAKDLPSPGNVNKRFLAESTKIYDRSGSHLLYEVHGEEKRTVIPFDQMPEVIKFATIALEDQDFYHHYGIKFSSIFRAALKDIITLDTAQGGSTITQQFVKNSLLTSERSFTRKIKEAILSLEMETKFSKDEILAMYLNEIPYGANAYGVEAASQTFFGKPARELALDEACVLASLPRGTTYYSPYGSRPERLINRKDYCLTQMARLGYITEEQAQGGIDTPTLDKVLPQKDIIAAPHFVMYIKDYLQAKYGDQAVEQGGYKVITTLDWDKQQIAEQVVKVGAENNARYKAENAALVAIDPKTAQVLSMVGSKDYFAEDIDGQVNVTIRDRQPGSSFKPYVYLAAFARGYLPETMLYDVKTQFETAEGKSYEPNNYDGKFHGPLPMMKTLGGSLNVPAVKTLYLVGVKEAVTIAKSLGIGGLNDPGRLGLSLVLGGGEVKLLEHVHAMSTLATGGMKHDLTAILRIEDSKGEVLEEFQAREGERVVEEKYVAMLDSILVNNDNRAWIFGDKSPLRFDDRQVAAKTGTTNEWRDGWTMGYTPSLAVGVWAGNNDNRIMAEGADGVLVAAPIWRAFLDRALVNYNKEEFPKYRPEDEIGDEEGKASKPMLAGFLEEEKDLKVCKIPDSKNYCLANSHCPDGEAERRNFTSTHDILHYVDRDDPRGPKPEKPERDPQYENWEKAVEKWYEKEGKKDAGSPPTDECDAEDFKKYRAEVKLTTPSSASSSSITLTADVDAPYGVREVTYRVDGDKVGSTDEKPYSVKYDIPSNKNNKTITIEVEVEDDKGYKDTDEKDLNVAY